MPRLDTAGSRLSGTALEAAWRARAEFVVVGAGALGAEVFRQLCVLRPARILVIDPDRIEETDLAKSWLFAPGSVGRGKACHLAALGREYAPETQFLALTCEFADVGWQDLARASLVFSCVDNDLARLEIALACRKLAISVCDAGLAAQGASAGRVSWFAGYSGACFGCKLRPQRLRELLLFAQADVRSCSLAETGGGFSLTPTMASLIASLQVDFGVRQWLAQASESETIEIALTPEATLRTFTTPISAACPLHEPLPDELRIPAKPGMTFRDLIPQTSAQAAILLDWPYSTRARCLACSCEWQPFVRCAVLRSRGRCPACGASAIIEVDSVKVIDRDSPWAECTPEQIGLPSNHLFALRFSGQ
ncbi:MAG TPA: ThiF family adenylyltransferase [Bryobacteraceae bacterium]|jgi:adenylyltransferase/sulfurtransferase|nr:ThiF family adenylyltransferase [Bryobacteraceae bacterium]